MYGFAPFPPSPKHAKLWKLYLAGSAAIDFGLFMGLLVFGGWPLLTVIEDAEQYLKARQSREWKSVPGTISSSGTVREQKGFAVVAAYSYVVDGQAYTGNRMVFAARRPVFALDADADQFLAPFGRLSQETEFDSIFDQIRARPDRSATVYYDPISPQDSTLRQEYFANPELGTLWPAIPISAFLIIGLFASVRSWWRYIAKREYELAELPRLPA